ncbi:FtsB family cell division protein [Nigerium massiliense]|uniref:FtsB family cell division protein n=1 Tax=Nigerium massiliense TaxID=1522317 RepID=UPI000BE8CE79|nr:septum formation initiator family protein [Nigerium massiliense]
MARDKRLTRQPTGPTRTMRRQRGARSAATPVEASEFTGASAAPRGRFSALKGRLRPGGRGKGLAFTHRALILFAVLALLALSYANSLRTYLNQQATITQAQQQVTERQQRVTQLEDQLNRWNDPNYVKSQARTRLGWVMPGEVGYRVIGADGTVLTGSEESGALDRAGVTDMTPRWWDRLAGSIEAADHPAPARR